MPSGPFTSQSRIGASTVAKAALLLLSCLYLLGAAGAFTVAGKGGVEFQLRRKLLVHGFCHALVSIPCVTAAALGLARRRAADVSAAVALGVVTLFAFRAILSWRSTAFHIYLLLEPLVVLPCAAVIFWKLAQPNLAGNGKQ